MSNDNISSNSSKSAGVTFIPSNMAIVMLAIYSMILVVGTLGNGLVIYVTACRMKRTVNSVWFLNLALADFLFTAFLIFLIISASQNYNWEFGSFMCKLYSLMGVVNMFASIFLLVAISLDRFLSTWVVVWAQNKRTVRKAQLFTAVIWVTAMVCSSPYAIYREVKPFNGRTLCSYQNGAPFWALAIFRFIMGFFIPFLLICASYVAIGLRARRLQKTRNRRSLRIIFAIVLAFFICWFPYHIVHFLELKFRHSNGDHRIIASFGPVTVILSSVNSCLNPILYVFMCDEFQKKLKQSICFVLESALAEERLSFMSTRSLSSHLSRISRKSESATPTEKNDPTFNFAERKVVMAEEKETLSTE